MHNHQCGSKQPSRFRKYVPTVILLAIAILAGGTDVFSNHVRELVQKTLIERATQIVPYALNLLIAAIILNVAGLFYHPLTHTVERVLERSQGSDRGKDLVMKGFRLFYWVAIIFVVVVFFAQELMGKMVLGFSVFGAAVTLAMQGVANDFVCGVMMQFTHRVRVDEKITVSGMSDVSGKVVDVGYLATIVDTKDGKLTVPNRRIWESAIKTEKSKLQVPS